MAQHGGMPVLDAQPDWRSRSQELAWVGWPAVRFGPAKPGETHAWGRRQQRQGTQATPTGAGVLLACSTQRIVLAGNYHGAVFIPRSSDG